MNAIKNKQIHNCFIERITNLKSLNSLDSKARGTKILKNMYFITFKHILYLETHCTKIRNGKRGENSLESLEVSTRILDLKVEAQEGGKKQEIN